MVQLYHNLAGTCDILVKCFFINYSGPAMRFPAVSEVGQSQCTRNHYHVKCVLDTLQCINYFKLKFLSYVLLMDIF